METKVFMEIKVLISLKFQGHKTCLIHKRSKQIQDSHQTIMPNKTKILLKLTSISSANLVKVQLV